MRKIYSRIAATLMAAVMVFCALPATILMSFAAETVLDAAIFCSDVHGSTSDLTSVLGGMKNSGVTYSSIGFVGDTCLTVAKTESAVNSGLGYTPTVMFSYAASHDTENSADISTNWNYSGEVEGVSNNYLVYTIRETDMQNSSDASTAAPAFTTWYNSLTDAQKKLPIFIMSHRPLHARRNDNAGAATWYDAISAAAESSDIVFFWAHNHTQENSTDTAAYYVAKDGTETITVCNGDTVIPNFTYMNAGYINANNQSPGRINVATTVQITADSLIFQDYNSSGEYTGTYAHNVTVEREFAATEEATPVVPETLEIVCESQYYVGESLDDPSEIVVTYSDKTTVEKLSEGTASLDNLSTTCDGLTDGKFTTAGTYTVTYTYTVTVDGQSYAATAEKAVTVSELNLSRIEASGTTVYTVGDDLTFTVKGYIYSTSGTTTVEIDQDACEITCSCMKEHEGCGSVENMMNTVADGTNNDYHQITVTYGGKSTTYSFTVGEADVLTDDKNNTGVKVHVFDGVFSGITAVESTNAHVTNVTVDKNLTNYKAYDITPVGGLSAGNYAKISLPVDESWDTSKIVAYYVSDDGATVEKMDGEYADGYYTFRVSHFSTYIVGESTEIEVPDPTIAENVTGTTTEKKTIYQLVSSLTAGETYLIVSRNTAGSGYGLAGSTTGASVTVKAADDVSSVFYIDDKGSALEWTASSGWAFTSGSYELGYSNGLSFSTEGEWTFNNNRLYQSVRSGRNTYTYYLRCNSGTWSASTTQSHVYFYQKVEVDVTVSANGTYSIAGDPAEVEKVVVSGTTVTLGSTLTFEAQNDTITTTDTTTDATYEIYDADGDSTNGYTGDPNNIISNIENGVVTFTGNYGKALVKVSYTVTVNDTNYPVDNYIVITAKAPYYEITIKDENDKTVSGTTVSLKGITNGQTVDLSAIVNLITDTGSTEETGATVEWAIPEEYQNIASVDENGVVTLKGVDGSFYVMVTYTDKNGNDYTAGVNFSVTTSQYSVPTDGTSDFPEYPNEGAVRFDKTATAVGNFSETGITQVELSMSGVPYSTGSEIDVVIMLDMTGSMSSTAMTAAEESAIAFAEQIVKNEDGTYNNNRIAVLAFNSGSGSPYTYWSLGTITADQWDSFCTAVRDASDNQVSGGTPYDEALAKCQELLAAAKTDGTGNNRQQFCVFVSDGGPTSYEYITNYDEVKAGTATSYTTSTASATGGANQSDSNFATIATYTHEYYSTLMKDDGVTMFSVLTGLSADDYPNCATILENIASSSDNAYVVEDGSNTTALTNAFSSIAVKILEAATNVVVQDKISDDYTMVFDIPTGSYTDNNTAVAEALKNQEFYIEFLEYALDANHERTTSTSKLKLYLGIDSTTNTYYAASDNAGTKFADPVFTTVATDDAGNATEKGYWSTVDSTYTAAAGEIVINVNGTYYKFIADGSGDYNMTSGAYAYGTIDATTSTSQDLVIVTPYFAYSAATRMLCWTVEKLTTVEYALSYFLFLDQSSTDIGKETEVAAGPYETNDWATLTYTNFNGNDCQQHFPVPQMTWNGAQVSYVFYLVNAAGQPINKSGQVVDFANATFITDVFTHTVVWNGDNAVEELNVSYLATDLLPDAYKIYDENAEYTIHVYQTESGQTVFDYFIIDGSAQGTVNANGNTVTSIQTTKVYNTKAGDKFDVYGTYSASAVGTEFKTTDAAGNSVTITTTYQASLDYSDTTVAFAVVWEPKLVEDTVVVDFGLDVLINVVQNDNLQNTVSGIGVGTDAYGSTEMNTGVSTTSKLGTADLTVGGHTISIENENQIRFSQGSMVFAEPVVFYYESPVEFYEGSNKQTGYMYSSVTVIPATTIYYEDEFVTLTTSTKSEDGTYTTTAGWDTNSTKATATQDQDRPGASQISGDIDADNLYGYDSAYAEMSQYSMGSAAMVNVYSGKYANAEFTFYGTGFDIISMTDTTTGTILVDVYYQNDAGEWTLSNDYYAMVDTYYGYAYNSETKEWYTVANDPNALYQVPVIKMEGMTYGYYKVVITVSYMSAMDHTTADGYNFYLDAIRIYDPTGVVSGETANDTDVVSGAYTADGEGWPVYEELRNNVIEASNYDVTENADGTITVTGNNLSGAIFIDCNDATTSIADYVNYGPNNELYLAKDQAIAFNVAVDDATVADVQLGIKVGNGDTVTYTINNDEYTVKSATDLYYSILEYAKAGTVTIKNVSGGILSITNIKVTYTEAPAAATSLLWMDGESAGYALMSLRSTSVEDDTVTEDTESEETTAPETETETETETEAPETETETEAPETETETETEPEDTESEESETSDPVAEVINKVVNAIKNVFSKFFGWFR